MSKFDLLLKALQAFKAQGDAGFEGLVRDCLEKLSQRTLRLQKSGAQGGQDFRSDTNPGSPMIAIEAKRFQATTNLPLDELKSKLRESLESSPAPDLWGVVFSSEMKQPDWSELEQIGAEYGVSLLCMDWREAPGTLPVLAALCAAGKEIAQLRLGSNLAATFDAIERHPDFGRITDNLRRQLNAPEVGFDLAKEAAANWLIDAVGSASKAKQVLRSHADILSAEAHRISRPGVEQKISDWWSAGPKAPLALLGDEGRGKTWIALSWCLTKIKDTGAPLVLVTSAKDIQAEDAGAIITGLLHRCMPSADKLTLQYRLRRWVERGSSAKVLIIIDGLNEKWHIDWNEVVKSFEVEPWKGRVSLILTARSGYWRDDLYQLKGATEDPIAEVVVPEFTDAELDQYLATYKLQRSDLPRALLALIRIPRFAQLAIALRDRLNAEEDLTIGRLVLEDWRSRLAQRGGELKVDDESLLNFVADLGRDVLSDRNFSISEKQIHERLSADSGRDLNHYRAAMNEIVEGLWLTRSAQPHRYKINDKLLPYAIGLDLAREIESLTDRVLIDDVIARYEEQLRGADIGVAILRAAASTSFARQKATKVALEALLATWIGSQNFRSADFEEMWPLISRNPDIFLDCGEHLWRKQAIGRGEGEILVKGLANAAKWPIVETALIKRFSNWAGAFGKNPARWWHGEKIPVNEDRERLTQDNLATWLSTEASYSRRISGHFRPEEDDWLPEAAFAIVSYIKRKPFIETLVTWAVTRAIMSVEYGVEQFEWLLRLNGEDQAAAQDTIVQEIKELRNLSNPVATAAASILSSALALPELASATVLMPPAVSPMRGPWPEYGSGNVIIWADNQAAEKLSDITWIERLSRFASDPTARLSVEDQTRLSRIAAEAINGGGLADKVPFGGDGLTLSLSRWAPGSLGAVVRRMYADLPDRAEPARGDPVSRLEELNLVLQPEQRETLLRRGLEKLKSLPKDPDDLQRQTERRLKNIVVAGSIGKTAAEQIEMLKLFLPSFAFSVSLARLMTSLESEEVQTIFDILLQETDEPAIASWLGYLGTVGLKELPQDASIALKLSQHPNKDVRGEAISLIWASRDETLGKAFVDSGWTHVKGQDREEALTGTYLISKFGTHLDIDAVRQRIVPQALPHLVEARGLKDAELQVAFEYVQELLDEQITGKRKERCAYPHVFEAKEAWRRIVLMDGEVLIKKTREAAKAGRMLGMFNIFPLTEVMEAILEVRPSEGAEIWLLVKQTHRQNGTTIGDFDRLQFAKSQHADLAKLRHMAFDDAKSDAQLADAVFWSLHNEHEDWLLKLIREDLNNQGAGRVARGLTIAGFLDSSTKAEHLWKQTIDSLPLSGWLFEVRAAARLTYQRNIDARYWLEQYLTAADYDRAFDYFNLFIERQDSRSHIWTGPIVAKHRQNVPHALFEHMDAKIDERQSLRKKVEDAQKKTLFFTAIGSSISPWL